MYCCGLFQRYPSVSTGIGRFFLAEIGCKKGPIFNFTSMVKPKEPKNALFFPRGYNSNRSPCCVLLALSENTAGGGNYKKGGG